MLVLVVMLTFVFTSSSSYPNSISNCEDPAHNIDSE